MSCEWGADSQWLDMYLRGGRWRRKWPLWCWLNLEFWRSLSGRLGDTWEVCFVWPRHSTPGIPPRYSGSERWKSFPNHSQTTDLSRSLVRCIVTSQGQTIVIYSHSVTLINILTDFKLSPKSIELFRNYLTGRTQQSAPTKFFQVLIPLKLAFPKEVPLAHDYLLCT